MSDRARAVLLSAVFFLAAAGMRAEPALSANSTVPCDDVVSYWLYPVQGGPSKEHEWWIFDPRQGRSWRYLSSPRGFSGVRWDTTFKNVWFSSGDSIYSAPWHMGAKARPIAQLPEGHERWWFNPDSACWQALRVQNRWQARDDDYYLYGGELWQSPRDRIAWRMIRADSVALIDPEENQWAWRDRTPIGNEVRTISVDELASEAWDQSWGPRRVPLDLSTITILAEHGPGYIEDQWYFLPTRAFPNRGVAFRSSGPLAPEHDWEGVVPPFYLVDLERRTKKPIDDTIENVHRSLVAERCGLLLVPGLMGNPYVIDFEGNVVSPPLPNSEWAIWVSRPR